MAKILIIEDNAASMKLATFLLELAGHAVLGATDAEAGLALARDEQPSLILNAGLSHEHGVVGCQQR